MSPEFEWDEDKAAENLAIHGVAFRKATLVFLDPLSLEEIDDRVDYGEDRYIRIGIERRATVDGRLYGTRNGEGSDHLGAESKPA